ncbi:DUF2064 domain-containing protein [Halalkalibaculum sp. DA3122]|uniref:TIGR04282 family arsenosugar biosynthesis glycosyltransferase n=1 Tax=unclassified Halalkalibaculum TaxID=2964617 RepID=UPI0037553460
MASTDINVAVLFFTRSAEAEGGCKRFAGDNCDRRHVHIASSLIEHTRRQIRRTGLPVVEIDEKMQKGGSFGERFAHAFEQVFNAGYEHVIAVGNDTPQLKAAHISEAARRLAAGTDDIVLGPAEDGGTWLMGYSREAFEADSFQELPWRTPRLFDTILEQSSDQLSIARLESYADIDNHASLVSFIGNAQFLQPLFHLIHLIRGILAGYSDQFKQECLQTPTSPASSSLLLRAPPFIA